MELVIVLTIIGILVGSGAWMMMGWIDEARYEKARMAIRDVDLAIKGFERGNYSRPPTQDQGLKALVEKSDFRAGAPTLAAIHFRGTTARSLGQRVSVPDSRRKERPEIRHLVAR